MSSSSESSHSEAAENAFFYKSQSESESSDDDTEADDDDEEDELERDEEEEDFYVDNTELEVRKRYSIAGVNQVNLNLLSISKPNGNLIDAAPDFEEGKHYILDSLKLNTRFKAFKRREPLCVII